MAYTKEIPPYVKTIADLIQWLANEQHEGVTSGVSHKVGASIASANFWKRGDVVPGFDYMERLVDVYHLPYDKVLEIWRRDRAKRRRSISGGALGLIIALGLLSPAPSAAAEIPPLGVVQVLDKVSLIRRRLRALACRLPFFFPIWSAA